MQVVVRELMLLAASTGVPVVFEVTAPLQHLFPDLGSYLVMRSQGERLITVERAVSEREFMELVAQSPLPLRPVSPSAEISSYSALAGLPWRLDGPPRLPSDARRLIRLEP